MSSRAGLAILLCGISVLGFGCGGHHNSSSAPTTSEIRLANATHASNLVMNAAGITDATVAFSTPSISSGAVSDYSTVKAQTYTLGVSPTSGSLTASTQSQGLTAATNYTLLAFERGGTINTYTLVDNQVVPSSGFAQVLVANAAGDAGTLDVFLVSSNATLNGVAPVFTSVIAKSTSSAKAIAAGTYDIVVTANGKPTDVRLTIPGVTFNSGDIVTIALTSTVGGALVDGALVNQGGGMKLAPSTFARIRVVGAFPPNGSTNSTITATVGTTSLGALTAPSVGSYKLVPAGTSTYSVTVDNTAVASLPAATFANGGDYTILIAGTPASPTINVLVDNNQPSSSGNANIRLVNAAVAGTITLDDNFVPIDADVAYGQASEYGPATPLSTSVLQITSPVAAFATNTLNNVNVASGGVYTIFVLGSAANPVVSLAKDR